MDGQTDGQTGRQVQAGRQTDRQAGRQTDRQTDRQKTDTNRDLRGLDGQWCKGVHSGESDGWMMDDRWTDGRKMDGWIHTNKQANKQINK